MNDVLLHVGLEDGVARDRPRPEGDLDAARRFAAALRAASVPITAAWTVRLVAIPPGGFVFELAHARGVSVSRSWLCFDGAASAAFWQRIFEDVASGDVRAACPQRAPWLATSLRAGGLSLLMGDDKLRGEADSIALRTGWALLIEPHDHDQTVFPLRKRPPATGAA